MEPVRTAHSYHSFYYDELGHDPVTDDFSVPAGTEMTAELLAGLIDEHKRHRVPRYERLKAAYEEQFNIFDPGAAKDAGKPDNRLAAGFPRCISDTFRGYFIGNPVAMQAAGEAEQRWLEVYARRNNQEDVDAELAKMCDNYGNGYELMYQDEAGNPASVALSPISTFVVYDDSVVHRPLFGVRYAHDDDGRIRGSFSDAENVVKFAEGGNGIELGDVEAHYFGGVPVIEYVQNAEKRGLYEGVLNLVEAYCKALSEKANDVDYFADSYLKVIGYELKEENKADMRSYRIINLFGDGEGTLDADFITKPSADGTQENLLDRLETLIFKLSMVPDISKEDFGSASGIALKMRMQPMSNLAKAKERKFVASMRRRLRLLANYPQQGLSDWAAVEIKMSRNMPEDLQSEAALQGALVGLVSEETRLGLLPFVDSVEAEQRRMEEEKAAKAAPYGEGYPTARAPEQPAT